MTATDKVQLVPVTINGTLSEADFSTNTCRISAGDKVVTCAYPDELRPAIKDALGDVVEAVGEAKLAHGNGNPAAYKRVKLARLRVVERGPASTNRRKPITAQALIDLGMVGMWEDRDDIDDSIEYAHQLREQTWGGRA